MVTGTVIDQLGASTNMCSEDVDLQNKDVDLQSEDIDLQNEDVDIRNGENNHQCPLVLLSPVLLPDPDALFTQLEDELNDGQISSQVS